MASCLLVSPADSHPPQLKAPLPFCCFFGLKVQSLPYLSLQPLPTTPHPQVVPSVGSLCVSVWPEPHLGPVLVPPPPLQALGEEPLPSKLGATLLRRDLSREVLPLEHPSTPGVLVPSSSLSMRRAVKVWGMNKTDVTPLPARFLPPPPCAVSASRTWLYIPSSRSFSCSEIGARASLSLGRCTEGRLSLQQEPDPCQLLDSAACLAAPSSEQGQGRSAVGVLPGPRI